MYIDEKLTTADTRRESIEGDAAEGYRFYFDTDSREVTITPGWAGTNTIYVVLVLEILATKEHIHCEIVHEDGIAELKQWAEETIDMETLQQSTSLRFF